MKKLIALAIFTISLTNTYSQEDPVLMTIDGDPIALSEFTYIYEKNNGKEADYSRESIEEYMELFTNFKLKVKKARDMKLDTIKALQNELGGYRKQLAKSYLMEKELSQRLLDEMWERRQYDVRISHILFRLRPNPSSTEIDKAITLAKKIKAQIDAGATFEEMAESSSTDPASARKQGDLGFITAWLPSGFYNLENTIYKLEIGEISDPVVSKLGVHLVKVTDKRPAKGKIQVAHILKRHKNEKAKEEIDALYQLVKSGKDFAALARENSEDKTTSDRGGRLDEFGINTFETSFEEAAFALQNDGDISVPVKTSVGWHIIKRLNKPEESEAAFKARMKVQLPRLDRYEIVQEMLVDEIKEETGYQRDENLYSEFLSRTDSTFMTYQWRIPTDLVDNELLNFGKDFSYSLKDFTEYARRNTRMRLRYNNEASVEEAVDGIYEAFINEKALEYEEKNLERKYPDFKALMREYEEGILLFEVSKMEVWDKASKDTTGLQAFYEKNKNNYYDTPEAKAAIFAILPKYQVDFEDIYNYAADHTPEETLNKFNEKITKISIEVNNIDKDNQALADIKWEKGVLSPLSVNDDGQATFIKIMEILPIQYKSLQESKGYVIADYQQYLEKQWINELKKEYNIKWKDQVLGNLIK